MFYSLWYRNSDSAGKFVQQALSKITSTGAMTFCFIQAIERGHGTTYGSILNAMRTAIRDAAGSSGPDLGGGVVTSLLTMLLTGGSVGVGGLRQVLLSSKQLSIFT